MEYCIHIAILYFFFPVIGGYRLWKRCATPLYLLPLIIPYRVSLAFMGAPSKLIALFCNKEGLMWRVEGAPFYTSLLEEIRTGTGNGFFSGVKFIGIYSLTAVTSLVTFLGLKDENSMNQREREDIFDLVRSAYLPIPKKRTKEQRYIVAYFGTTFGARTLKQLNELLGEITDLKAWFIFSVKCHPEYLSAEVYTMARTRCNEEHVPGNRTCSSSLFEKFLVILLTLFMDYSYSGSDYGIVCRVLGQLLVSTALTTVNQYKNGVLPQMVLMTIVPLCIGLLCFFLNELALVALVSSVIWFLTHEGAIEIVWSSGNKKKFFSQVRDSRIALSFTYKGKNYLPPMFKLPEDMDRKVRGTFLQRERVAP